MRYPLMVGSPQNLAAGFTYFNSLQNTTNVGWTINEGFREHMIPVPCRIYNWYGQLGTSPGGGISRIWTVRKNRSASILTMTFSGTDTDKSDLTNVDNFIAGDAFDFQSAQSGGTPATTTTKYALIVEAPNQIVWANTQTTVGATRYMGYQNNSGVQTTEAAAQQVMPTSGTVKNLIAKLGTGTLASGSYVVTLYKNGSSTGLTVTLDSSNQTATDTTHTVTVAAGDTLSWEMAYNAPSTARTINIGTEFVADIHGESILLGSSGGVAQAHATREFNTWYNAADLWSATESLRQAYGIQCTFQKLYVKLGTAPGIGNTRTVALRKAGADTALSVTISGTNTTGSATASVDIAAGDLIGVGSVNSASAANSDIQFGLVAAMPTGNMFSVF